MELRSSETLQNLMRAFAGETQARARYEYAAESMRAQGYPALGRLFTFTAEQERQHARVLWELVRTAGAEEVRTPGTFPVDLREDARSLLLAAADYEFKEAQEVYPAFAACAQGEGFDSIAKRLTELGKIEQLHGERFCNTLSALEDGSLFKGDDNTRWLCLNCGNVVTGAEPPSVCGVCASPAGFFVRFEHAPFQ